MGLMWFRSRVYMLGYRGNLYKIGWGCYREWLKVIIRILYISWAFGLRQEQDSMKVIF